VANPNRLLVDPGWLRAHLDESALVVAHVGWSADGGTPLAEEAFERGHVPGAVFLDVDRDLAATPFVAGPGRHPLPRPDVFAATMRRIGVADESFVVAYDDVGGSIAARLWWMLDSIGHTSALLDGGLRAWGTPLETGPARARPEAHFACRPWPRGRIVESDAVAAALRSGSTVVLDARAAERYRGDIEPIDPVAGHIPGARNAPWVGNLDEDGRFLSSDALRARYAELGVADASSVVAQCGSGVTSCHAVFAMRLAGLGDVALHEGSWSDWVREERRPVATGPEPGDAA
jgi:thiosulfate/3-mercaptopyruvate sulfurtransferase